MYFGRNTFHVMGTIMCTTPDSGVTCQKQICRLKSIPTSNVEGSFGYLPLKNFQRHTSGLKEVLIKDIDKEYPIVKIDTLTLVLLELI